ESQMTNIEYGDRDSLGLHQQRISIYPKEVATDVARSQKAFLGDGLEPEVQGKAGLLDYDDWADIPYGDAAQQVQISAHPRAYDKWENMAKELVSVLSGSSTGSKGTSIENEGC